MFFPSSAVVAVTLWLLMGFSIVTWTLVAIKVRLQWRLTRLNREFSQAFWNARGLTEAENRATMGDGPLARLCRTGFEVLRDLRSARASTLELSGDRREVLQAVLRQQIQKERHELESGLAILASIGSTAPFVGLFGTVWGIMHALEEISRSGSASLQTVAGPIGETLIATAMGIAAAVPAVLAYNYGLRRARSYVAELEDFASHFGRITLQPNAAEGG